MGKSTLVKKITSDWANQRPSIKGLSSFHLLFYAELRDIVNTFDTLLECSLGEVHRSFKDGDLVKAVLGQKTLVILDGYDELNKSSSGLFNHILSLNKLYSQLTVIVTTRPEAEEKLNAHIESRALKAVHLRLVGIKANKREEFVTKYFLSLPKDSSVLQELDNLLKFLKKTENKMSIVWEVTYNLCLLTILWMFKPDVVNRITTEAELYWQIFLLIISKLEERLQRNPSTCDIELSVLQHKISIFLEELSLESLKGLKDDFINLPHSVYQRLTALCLRLGVPIEELAGAFLKKVTSFNNSYYTFPHKGFMEFMGGYNIYKQVTCPDVDRLAIQEWSDELYQTSIPLQIQIKMLASLKSTKTTSVTDFVKELHGGSLPDSLEKYQNLLIQTLSIFHVREVEVPLATKIETLKLLEESGLEDKDSVLKVMHNIKCSDKVARWIAQRFHLIDDNTKITDSSFESYITLLAATDPPLPNRDKIRIFIDLKESISGFDVLTKHLLRHQVYPRVISLHRSLREFTSINAEETESIKSLLSNDCEIYRGIWNPTFQISRNVKDLFVWLPDQVSLDAFCRSLQRTKEIGHLGIHFSVKDISSASHPIPFLKQDPIVIVFVSDVQEEDIEKVGDILRALQPQDARRSFYSIYFPRCSKKRRSPRDFLFPMMNSLKGVRVEDCICFREDERPDDEALVREMDLKAKKFTGCSLGVQWRTDAQMFHNIESALLTRVVMLSSTKKKEKKCNII
ncbi:NACHT, LRR and PYD domains-containing protein 10-like [Palaemon carinicauda]|uniref:NACHT, LRR and PYD domains-containing protein 10-like n=1 Tax=Palaemon carinicauda TaxID=392227 RepID=UPI0035B63776